MKTVSAEKLAARFKEYLDASQKQPILVTQEGKPVAVLFAVQNQTEAEELARGRTRSLKSVLQESAEQIQQGAGIPHDQFWDEVERARANKSQPSARRKKA